MIYLWTTFQNPQKVHQKFNLGFCGYTIPLSYINIENPEKQDLVDKQSTERILLAWQNITKICRKTAKVRQSNQTRRSGPGFV